MKNYIVTWAQNNTSVHKKFKKNLEKFCKDNKAEMIVIAGVYYTNRVKKQDPKWELDVETRLIKLNTNLSVFANIPILPTAVRPLSGFEVFAGESSGIFGHPKYQLQPVATAGIDFQRFFTTTGAITKPNYSISKAGAKAEPHHVYGATFVQVIDSRKYHLRQIVASKDGSFWDLDKFYGDADRKFSGLEGLVLGDVHVRKIDPLCEKATFEMIEALRPRIVVCHDTHDHHISSHHTSRRGHENQGSKTVKDEIQETCSWVKALSARSKSEVWIVDSNHDRHLDLWLQRLPETKDVEFWHWLNFWVRKQRRSPFEVVFRSMFPDEKNVRFLSSKIPSKICDIAVHFHGDRGINGARGSILAYAKLGCKTITGHDHSPQVLDGAYRVGTLRKMHDKLDPTDYHHPPTTWGHANIGVYPNGKRVMLHIINGRWR